MDCMNYSYGLCWTLMDLWTFIIYYYGLYELLLWTVILYYIIMYCMSNYEVYDICTVYVFRLLIYIVWDECHINLLMTYVNVIFMFRLNKKQEKLCQNFLPHVKSCSTSIACSIFSDLSCHYHMVHRLLQMNWLIQKSSIFRWVFK
jgi:hypothetical protein